MSGRLIILGKKGYCPWNSKNLERIQRDEKEHREAQEREQEQEAAKASALRLSILKKNSNEGEKSLQRFSLFESEEKLSSDKSNKAYVSKSTSFDRKGTARNDSERNREERRTSLERNFLTRRDQRSQFYLKPPPTDVSLGKKEIQRHRDMDPMKQFRESEEFTQETSHQKSIQNVNSDCAVRERKRSSKRGRSSDDDCSSDGDMKFERTKERHRKKKSRHREDSRRHKHRKRSKSKREKPNHSACNSASSIKELREKRKKREEQERQRQAAFLNS